MIILAPILAPLVVVFVPFGLMMWLADKVDQWKRARNRANPHRMWFAWRPVRFSGFWDDVPDQWLWLETVQARWKGRWEYRPAGFVSKFDGDAA